MRSTRLLLTALATTAALAGTASAAQAATLAYDGNDLVFRAAPGEKNSVVLSKGSFDDSKVSIGPGYGNVLTSVPGNCDDHRENGNFVECPRPAGAIKYELGDGDDSFGTSSDFWHDAVIVVDGSDGTDDLRGFGARETLIGGPGNDYLSGWLNADTLDGGDGDDKLEAGEGNDVVRGGNGNDNLAPDGYEQQSSDVVDGGPGIDTIDGDYSSRWTDSDPQSAFTLGGGADDGRPGENDDIQGVERITLSSPGGRIVGTDAPEYMKLHQVGDPGVLIGNGGDDELRGGDGEDTVDGGAGNDKLDGGFGDDVITGGPGRDTILADQTTSECSYLWCKHPFGNDTVNARDGEADSVTCGTGTDRVVADAVDTVAKDCETVDKAAAPVPVQPAPTGKPKGGGSKPTAISSNPKVKLSSGQLKLRTALRSGLKLTIKGAKRGAKVKALDGRRTVGTGRVKAGGKVTIRFTKSAKKRLAKKSSVKLRIVAGSVRSTVTLAR